MQAKYTTEAIILLQEWMRANGISIASLTRKLNLGYQTAWNLFKRDHRPHLDTAIKIELLTKREVPCVSWKILIRPKRQPKLSKKRQPDQEADAT